MKLFWPLFGVNVGGGIALRADHTLGILVGLTGIKGLYPHFYFHGGISYSFKISYPPKLVSWPQIHWTVSVLAAMGPRLESPILHLGPGHTSRAVRETLIVGEE